MEEDKNQNNYGNSEVGIKKIAMNDELTVSTIFLIFIPERRKNLLKRRRLRSEKFLKNATYIRTMCARRYEKRKVCVSLTGISGLRKE